MKKLFALMMVMVMLFVFAGCEKTDTSSNADDTSETAVVTVVSSETANENDIIRQYSGVDDRRMAILISNRDFSIEVIGAISLANGYGSYEDACGYLWSQGYLKWVDHCTWCGESHYRINEDNPELVW